MGNRRGLNIVAAISWISAQDSRIAFQENCLAEANSRRVSLEQRVRCLSQSLHQYKLARARFRSTYERDVLKYATDAGRDIIRSANTWAHGGEAIIDAQLYDGLGGRRDSSVYKKLYGLDPKWVFEIGEFFAAQQS